MKNPENLIETVKVVEHEDGSATYVFQMTKDLSDFDDVVYIRQVDDTDLVNVIIMSPQQWLDITCGMELPHGAYCTKGVVDD